MIDTRIDGGVARIVLDAPRANVLDQEMIEALRSTFPRLRRLEHLKLLVFEGRGRHFSYGAKVEEHLPDQVEEMLPAFHALFVELEALGLPTAAVVRGQCLGGGAELATWCGRVFADPTAHIGFPEVTLGVFPPVAALALSWRTGGRMATELVLSGRVLKAPEAQDAGLVDDLSEDPEAALQAWYASYLRPRSAHALCNAWRASRAPLKQRLELDLPALECQYLDELMAHPDPTEGLRAFLERRPPQWAAK